MSYKVALRKNATGEVKIIPMDGLDWEDHSLYWWTDGNFGCDCNRALQFGDEDDSCSEDRFTALYAELPDGTRIVIDEPRASHEEDTFHE